MDNEMLEQIQQMITTANESLRQNLRQDIAVLGSNLGERIQGIEQAQRGMESRLNDRIEETKRHSGILLEDLHHKLDLVIEGQQFIRQDIANVRSDMDAQTRDTRSLIGAAYRDLSQRLDQHEQRHHN